MSWWWCFDHKRVEEGLGCGSSSRAGPYGSEQQAATAMDRIHARGAEQEARDKADEAEKKKRR
jgi:hypothetical protein